MAVLNFPKDTTLSISTLYRLLFCWTFLVAGTFALGQSRPILVEVGQSFEGNLFGYLQEVVVRGEIRGDVGAFGADVTIDGTVVGNVSVINGSVTILSGGRVSGNILCTGGSVTVEPQAQYDGKTFHFFSGNRNTSLVTLKSRLAMVFAQVLILFLFVLATFYLFPNQVDKAAFELSHDTIKTFSKGLLTLFFFLIAIFLSFLLIVVLIGFPLFLIFASGFLVMAGFGAVSVCYRLADVLVDRSGRKVTLTVSLFLVAAGLVVVQFIPILGGLTYAVVLILGIGTVITTRFGTNKQWFTRRKRFY